MREPFQPSRQQGTHSQQQLAKGRLRVACGEPAPCASRTCLVFPRNGSRSHPAARNRLPRTILGGPADHDHAFVERCRQWICVRVASWIVSALIEQPFGAITSAVRWQIGSFVRVNCTREGATEARHVNVNLRCRMQRLHPLKNVHVAHVQPTRKLR
jgi:hypothetical protein